MTCKIANNISLEMLLDSWGCKKLKSHKGGEEFFYENPIRDERTPSFSINIKKNIWVDFGIPGNGSKKFLGGNVIDLVMAIQKTDIKGSLVWLRNNSNNFDALSIKNRFVKTDFITPPSRYSFRTSKEIFSYALKDYLKERCIDIDIAKHHVKEIRFYDNEKKKILFSLGVKNNSGGYALRNKNRKVIITPHDIVYIPTNKQTDTLLIFEGTFDFLSYLMIKKTSVPEEDIIILNTLSHIKRAVVQIQKLGHVKKVVSFMDNPKPEKRSIESMEKALDILRTLNLDLYKANETFKSFGDLAEYWEKLKIQNRIVLTPLV